MFAAAERVVRAVVACNAILPQALYARMVRFLGESKERAGSFMLGTLGVALFMGVSSALVLYLIAPFAIPLLLGEGYQEAVWIARALSLIIPFYALAHTLSTQGVLALGKGWGYALVPAVAAVVNVVAIFKLVPIYGMWGIIYAMYAMVATITVGYGIEFLRHWRRL